MIVDHLQPQSIASLHLASEYVYLVSNVVILNLIFLNHEA